MKELNPRFVCPDGFSVSIQANEYAYCNPRNDSGPYTSVELGFPSDKPPEYIMDYCEDSDNPTDTVYGFVPVELVLKMLHEHGYLLEGSAQKLLA